MADRTKDLPKLPPPRDESDRKVRALLGIVAGGETGAKFADTMGYPSVAAAIRAGVAEANPDYVTTGEIAGPVGFPAMIGNAASEIGTGIKNWWTGNDPDKPTLKPLETYLSERRQPRTSREAYVNAAAEKFMASPAYQDMIKRNMIKASGRELRLIRDQAGLEWDKTNTPDALAKETQDLTTEYDKVVRPGYDRDLERYYAQSFGERNPGLSSLLPALGTLGAMLFTRGRFKAMADESNAITKEIFEAAQRGDSVALARARQKAAKLPGKGEKIATALAGLSIPVEAQLFQDIQDKHTMPPEYQDSSGTWKPSMAYQRAARNLDPQQDFLKTVTLPLASGVLGAATGYKLAPKMRPPPEELSPEQIQRAANEIEAGLIANDRIARLKASLSGPGTSPSGTAIGTNPTAGSIGSPGASSQIAAAAGHTAPGPLPALPPSIASSRAPYKSLPPLVRDQLRAAYVGDRALGPVRPGSMARKLENTVNALGFNVPVSRRRVKATNQAVEAFERAQGRFPQGLDWDSIFNDKTLAVPMAASLGLGALADREEYANGGLVTIRSKGGVPFTVSRDHASRFQGLIDDLEAAGYPIDAKQSGGYNPRNIAGTNTPSQHTYGRAIDINWNENARGTRGSIPRELALELAGKHGLTWGGVWKNPDDMHFEVAGAAPGVANRGVTTVAGLTPPLAEPDAGSSRGLDLEALQALIAQPKTAVPPPMEILPAQPIEAREVKATLPYQTAAFANGGSVGEPITVGPLHSRVPGRTDHLAITVPEGSFVIPADVVSYLGEGNSTAGLDRASEMFPSPRALRANGGKVPIAAAGGEFVVDPETVKQIGGGDLKRGHDRLDQFVLKTRQQHINHLKRLPRPEK